MPGIGFTPNQDNANPFVTQTSGLFSFGLTTAQIAAAGGAPITYYLNVTAPGYRTRMLAFTAKPAAHGLYTATVRALDGQPLARADSFALPCNGRSPMRSCCSLERDSQPMW